MYTFIPKASLLILLMYRVCETEYVYICTDICIWVSAYHTAKPIIHSLNLKKLKIQKLWNADISIALQRYFNCISGI